MVATVVIYKRFTLKYEKTVTVTVTNLVTQSHTVSVVQGKGPASINLGEHERWQTRANVDQSLVRAW